MGFSFVSFFPLVGFRSEFCGDGTGGETDAGGHGVEFVHGGGAGSEVELGVVSDVLVRFPEQLVVCTSSISGQWELLNCRLLTE